MPPHLPGSTPEPVIHQCDVCRNPTEIIFNREGTRRCNRCDVWDLYEASLSTFAHHSLQPNLNFPGSCAWPT